MKTKGFSFDLPEYLIAQRPPAERGTCRLMLVDRSREAVEHHRMPELPSLLPADSVLVLNDSKVRKARLYGTSETGGRVEFLLISRSTPERWTAVVSKAKKRRPGSRYHFPGDVAGEIEGDEGPYKLVRFTRPIDDVYLDAHGHVPLPPYIHRADSASDSERYQTVYADRIGSAAAPTAGLHFTPELLDAAERRGIDVVRLTLHVGIGTFLPIRSEHVEDHTMHREYYEVPSDGAEAVNRALEEGRQVVAVGTTTVRTLESAGASGVVEPGTGWTDLYIYPGYRFRVVSSMFTNFHTPESSLLVMVSAFAGTDLIRRAYRTAVEAEYRFFSYGDAMLIV